LETSSITLIVIDNTLQRGLQTRYMWSQLLLLLASCSAVMVSGIQSSSVCMSPLYTDQGPPAAAAAAAAGAGVDCCLHWIHSAQHQHEVDDDSVAAVSIYTEETNTQHPLQQRLIQEDYFTQHSAYQHRRNTACMPIKRVTRFCVNMSLFRNSRVIQ